MIKAHHTYKGKLVADFYSGYKLKRAFPVINFINEAEDEGLPILIIANHFSWWDGFIQYRLNNHFLHRRYHVMMLEEQLERFMILNQCGAFSVRKRVRDAFESLDYCIELLKSKQNLVLLFPQGEVQSAYVERIIFQSGINYILKHLKNRVQFIFNVNLTDYFSNKTPSLNIYTKTYNYTGQSLWEIEEAYNQFALNCKKQQKEL